MTAIRTTHVGSLPRPAEMVSRMTRKEAVSEGDLRQYLIDILDRQMSIGLNYINNGELPRMDYVHSTVGRISGFGASGTAPIPQDLEELPELSRRFSGRNGLITLNPKAPVKLPACSEPLVYKGKDSLRQELDMMTDSYNQSKSAYPHAETGLFFTAPSPGTVGLFMENRYYPDDDVYIENLASVMKEEYDIIAGYGLLLQVDCPDLAMGRHTRFKHLSESEFIARIHVNVQALNHALRSVNPEMCRVHICWGNYSGTHHCDIELKKIFNPLMNIKARYISVEASNHRHAHEWSVFRELPLPDDKVLMPGVIDTTSNIVEHPDLVAQRISNYVHILGKERVIAATDCGFATTASAANVSGEIAWLKLESLVEGARRAGRKIAK